MKTTNVRMLSGGLLLGLLLAPFGAMAAPTQPLPPLPTGHTALQSPADGTRFSFVVGGDNRATAHGVPMPPSFAEICREAGFIGPNFVLWTGDTIHGYGDSPAEAAAEYRSFLDSAATVRVPFFNVPGNHEKGLAPDGAALEAVYRQSMGPLYGSFDYGNSYFIGVDTTSVVGDNPEGGTIDAAQLSWLKADLAAHAGKAANIFVFMHHYVFGQPDPDVANGPDTGFKDVQTRDMLHALFVQSGVRAVFCGHAHLFWHAQHDGIDYFISGNAGAPLDATPQNGGFWGYMLVQVEGAHITSLNLQPWTLFVRTIEGDDGKATRTVVEADNYNSFDVPAHGLTVVMPAGHTYKVTAVAPYKKKSKPVAIAIATSSPAGGTVRLVLQTELPAHRTTRITVEPAD